MLNALNGYFGSFLRHGLAVAAGALGSMGVEPGLAGQFVEVNSQVLIAVGLYAVSQGLSVLNTKKNKE